MKGVKILPVPFGKLYSKQKQVVTHFGKPLLVLAGPGTGKTEVLTHRISYLINHKNIPQEEILAITFSKKAAIEMADRLKNFNGLENQQLRVSTLHAESLRLINKIEDTSRFLIADDESQLLLKDTIEDLNLNIDNKDLKKNENKRIICKVFSSIKGIKPKMERNYIRIPLKHADQFIKKRMSAEFKRRDWYLFNSNYIQSKIMFS